MDLLMGVDIGSTNTKAVVFDPEGNVVSEGSTETRLSHDRTHPTWTYWDPEDLWNGAKRAISTAVAGLKGKGRVVALGCSCFSADFAPVDAQLRPLYPFKSWHCARTVPQMQKWLESYSQNELLYRHGIITEKLVSLFTMRWLQENCPEVVRDTHRILFVSDYINMKLTGETVTDYTQAATSGAFDPVNGAWSEEFLNWAGFSTKQMPEARLAGAPIGRVLPEVARELGLSEETLVVVAAHDNECAALALGVRDEESAYNICGTWEMILALHRTPNFDEAHAQREIKAVRYLLPDTYGSLKFGLSGNLMEWAKDNFYGLEAQQAQVSGTSVWDRILEETGKVPPLSNGILVLPFKAGASGRDRSQLASGTILGIDNYLGRADVMHAIFEALGYQTRDFLENIEAVCARHYDKLICVGGPTRNRQLMQIKADICNRPVLVTSISEGTAMGAAMLSGVGAGVYRDAMDAMLRLDQNRRYTQYLPDAQRAALYEEAYRKYQRAGAVLSEL